MKEPSTVSQNVKIIKFFSVDQPVTLAPLGLPVKGNNTKKNLFYGVGPVIKSHHQ